MGPCPGVRSLTRSGRREAASASAETALRGRLRVKGETPVYFSEQVALQMAQERIAEAIRSAEQERAICPAVARTSARVRLGRTLVRLGYWISGQPSPAFS